MIEERFDETVTMSVSVYLDITIDIDMEISKDYFYNMNKEEQKTYLLEQYKKFHAKELEKNLNVWAIENRECYL